MDKTSDLYIEHLTEQAMLYDSTPTVAAEVQVDFGSMSWRALAPVTM
ncbi:MAG: hypothetical protein ACLSF6_03445 [Evtepia gabavorous]